MSRGIVSRTIRTLAVDGLFADIKENKVINMRIYLPYKNLKLKPQVERYIRKKYHNSNYALVSVEKWETEKTLYGCTEEHFMQFAEPYDEKTRKPIEKEI